MQVRSAESGFQRRKEAVGDSGTYKRPSQRVARGSNTGWVLRRRFVLLRAEIRHSLLYLALDARYYSISLESTFTLPRATMGSIMGLSSLALILGLW